MSNLCLSTTATASGSIVTGTVVTGGMPAYIIDDNVTGTSMYGARSVPVSSNLFGYTVAATLNGFGNITQVDLVHVGSGVPATIPPVFYWDVLISMNSTWTNVIGGSTTTPFGLTTVTATGSWTNVVGISITGTGRGSAQPLEIPPYFNIYPAHHQCYELRLWGANILAPTVISLSANNIDKTLATLNGSISDTGNSSCSTRGFDWGTSTAYGNSLVESGTFGIAQFTGSTSGLIPNYEYHFRAKAVNIAGTGYGSDITFYTLNNDEATKRMSRLVYDDMMSYMMEDY
jgi:hypothetical protein